MDCLFKLVGKAKILLTLSNTNYQFALESFCFTSHWMADKTFCNCMFNKKKRKSFSACALSSLMACGKLIICQLKGLLHPNYKRTYCIFLRLVIPSHADSFSLFWFYNLWHICLRNLLYHKITEFRSVDFFYSRQSAEKFNCSVYFKNFLKTFYSFSRKLLKLKCFSCVYFILNTTNKTPFHLHVSEWT